MALTRTTAVGTATYIASPKTPDMFVTTPNKPDLTPFKASEDIVSTTRVQALGTDKIAELSTKSGSSITNDMTLTKAEDTIFAKQLAETQQTQSIQSQVSQMSTPFVPGQDPGFSIPSTDGSLGYKNEVKVLQDKSLENQQWNTQKAKCPSFGCGLCTYSADTAGIEGALNELDQSQYINDQLNKALAMGNTDMLNNLFNCVKYVNSSVMPTLQGGLGKLASAGNSSAFSAVADKVGYKNVPALNSKLSSLTSTATNSSTSLTQVQNIFTAAGANPASTVSSSLGSRISATQAVDLDKLRAVTGKSTGGGSTALLAPSVGASNLKMATIAASLVPNKAA